MSRWRLFTGRSTGSHTVPPGMVDRRRHVGELHEVAEILDGGVAAALVEVADEGRAVDRREHRVLAADRDVARGLRACCMYSRGAVFWMIERGRPCGK